MLDSIEIRRYRRFEHVVAPGCTNINIIVGENGSGKTAFLEAIFLASGLTPELVVRTRLWRGFDPSVSGRTRAIEKSIWGSLFYQEDLNRPIMVDLNGSPEQERRLIIEYNDRVLKVPSSTKSRMSDWSPIIFRWQTRNLKTIHSASPSLRDGKLEFPPYPEEARIDAKFYPSNHQFTPGLIAGQFSELRIRNEEASVTASFSKLFPQIQELSIEIDSGQPVLFAKVKGREPRIPLPAVSGGMNKMAAMLFGMATNRNGIVLIDEIENGFHYSRLPGIWEAILEFSRHYDVQVFASTHSLECLKAGAMVAEDSPSNFSIIHIGQSQIRQFGGDRFVDAISADIEIR